MSLQNLPRPKALSFGGTSLTKGRAAITTYKLDNYQKYIVHRIRTDTV